MINVRDTVLETVCGITSDFPVHTLPEIAIAGKSNVGKSSLINCLIRRKAYAHVSSQPGRTQTINYYRIGDSFYLVDLPGYGYAGAAADVKREWGRMAERYLKQSATLKAVFLLVDIRHAPSENDRMMYEWICGSGYPPVLLLTKLDKIKRSQVAVQTEVIKKGLGCPPGTAVIPFSAETKQGRDETLSCIAKLISRSSASS